MKRSVRHGVPGLHEISRSLERVRRVGEPAKPFHNFRKNPWIDLFHEVQKHHKTDCIAPGWFGLLYFMLNSRFLNNFCSPTDPFTILMLQNPSHDVPELHKFHQSLDLEALKLGKCRQGNMCTQSQSVNSFER